MSLLKIAVEKLPPLQRSSLDRTSICLVSAFPIGYQFHPPPNFSKMCQRVNETFACCSNAFCFSMICPSAVGWA